MDLARIYARVGEQDLALQTLLSRSEDYRLTYGYLALHPDWDAVREDPRFQAYTAKFAPAGGRK